MFQQIIAIMIILFFLAKLFWQKRNQSIANSEFIFWLFFWLVAGLAIIFLKQLDKLVADLGFSGSGIEVLLYLGVALSFYYIFRLRLRLARLEKEITKIVRNQAINN